MKKITAIILSVFCVSVAAIPAFAQTKQHKSVSPATQVVRATVVSVDVAKKEIVVKNDLTAQEKTYVVSEKAASIVKAGDKVKIKIKAGSNTADSVEVIVAEQKKK